MGKIPIQVKIVIGIFLIGMLISMIQGVYSTFTDFYNRTASYKFEYKNLEQGQKTVWDNNFMAFRDKYNITEVNKETFITVTSIIMSARTDGPQVAWKWAHENQQIPYEEFTSFYKDLSAFTSTRYAENSDIEKKKQNIVREHNYLITSFPGVIYNHFLKIPLLEYKEGFVTPETAALFK